MSSIKIIFKCNDEDDGHDDYYDGCGDEGEDDDNNNNNNNNNMMCQGKPVILVLLDLSAAFNKIGHNVLFSRYVWFVRKST